MSPGRARADGIFQALFARFRQEGRCIPKGMVTLPPTLVKNAALKTPSSWTHDCGPAQAARARPAGVARPLRAAAVLSWDGSAGRSAELGCRRRGGERR